LVQETKSKAQGISKAPRIVACIPAYNEERMIGGVVLRALMHVDMVVVCDDGSVDLTGAIAEGLGAVVVRHERNLGYGAALQSLFTEARRLGADVVVTLDSDGQHDPGDISRLVGLLVDSGDVDIVIGSRFVDGGGSEASGWRENGIRLITGLVSNDGLSVTDAQSGFRVYSRRALDVLTLVEQGMGVSTEILLKAGERGLRVVEAPINISYDEGSSTHNPLVHGLDVVLSTVKHLSIRRPLLFYGVPGFVALCVAAVFWGIALRMFAEARTISTNVALVAFSGTIVGLMLMTTGIILWVLISVVREKV